MDEAVLQDLAGSLLDRAGLGSMQAMTRLSGGANNQTFKIDLASRPPVVFKRYFISDTDRRDRLGAEMGFLRFAWSLGIRNVPEPMVSDPDHHAALIGFIDGCAATPADITDTALETAADFVLALNPGGAAAPDLPSASEACFSLQAHLDTVAGRVKRLADFGTSEAGAFAKADLQPRLRRAEDVLSAYADRAQVPMAAQLAKCDRCVSPSDFGFHNVLVGAGGTLTFIDFEYAGLDDPAKLVCDFFCQPAVPVSVNHFDYFVARLGAGDNFKARASALMGLYRVKWGCIVLNDLLEDGRARRSFADAGFDAAGQLDKARAQSAAFDRWMETMR